MPDWAWLAVMLALAVCAVGSAFWAGSATRSARSAAERAAEAEGAASAARAELRHLKVDVELVNRANRRAQVTDVIEMLPMDDPWVQAEADQVDRTMMRRMTDG